MVTKNDEHLLRRYPYDLSGYFRFRSKPLEPDEKFAIGVYEDGSMHYYTLPHSYLTLAHCKEHLRSIFPSYDYAEIFGLHTSATVKQDTVMGCSILDCIYLKGFIVKAPPTELITSNNENQDEDTQAQVEAFLERMMQISIGLPKPFDEA